MFYGTIFFIDNVRKSLWNSAQKFSENFFEMSLLFARPVCHSASCSLTTITDGEYMACYLDVDILA